MKPASFRYVEADSEATLSAVLAEHGGDAKMLAGGQSLVPMMNFRIASPAVLIDINPVASLSYVKFDDTHATIGALTRHAMLEDSAEVEERLPLLHDAIGHVAHRAVRNRGTMGGSLALAYPGAEIPLVFVALGAEIVLGSARGERRLPAGEFVRGALDTGLDEDEYIQCARVPLPPRSSGSSFVEMSRRHGDFAIAAAAAVVETDAAGKAVFVRAAVSGGTGAPIRFDRLEKALGGTKPHAGALADLAEEAITGVEVFGDSHYPEEYRRHLLRSALLKALAEAAGKAKQRHGR